MMAHPSHATDELDPAVSGAGVPFEIKEVAGPAAANRTALDPDVMLPPAWAFGVLYGYYANQSGILDNLHRLQDGDFPVDAIWVDSAFWDLTTRGPAGYLDFKGDRTAFPDLRHLADELARRKVRFGVWIWDRVLDANPQVFQEFESLGYFKPGRIASNGWHNVGLKSVARVVDFANPAATALWMEKLRLFPYIYTHALLTRLAGRKMIQGELERRYQFLFGDAFLVTPVHEPGATHRTLWLPPGQRWIDFWTGQSYAGGREVSVPAPLAHLPLLVRAGAIIPMRDYAPSVLRGNNATLTPDVYPEGATAQSSFILYEDDGCSNAYLTNGFATTLITCLPSTNSVRLNIDPIHGDFDGRPKRRCWKLQMHLAAHPAALSINGKAVRWNYEATSQCLRLQWTIATSRPSELVVTRCSSRG